MPAAFTRITLHRKLTLHYIKSSHRSLFRSRAPIFWQIYNGVQGCTIYTSLNVREAARPMDVAMLYYAHMHVFHDNVYRRMFRYNG